MQKYLQRLSAVKNEKQRSQPKSPIRLRFSINVIPVDTYQHGDALIKL